MKYWIWVATIENGEIAIENAVIGLSNRFSAILDRIHKDDKGFIYIKMSKGERRVNKSTILAEFRIESEAYRDSNKLFINSSKKSKEEYPIRFKVKIITIFDQDYYFKPLVEKLNFVKNKNKWGMYFMGKSMIEISEDDYSTILNPASSILR